jgi:GT2 family glycosyltransferase
MDSPFVYIIIISFKNIEDTIETINSFLVQKYTNSKIIVCDNNIDVGIYNHLKKKFPALIFFYNPENPGWAKTNNDAILYAIQNHADYVILANNDISIEDANVLSLMVETAEETKTKHPDFLMGAKTNSYYERNQILNQGLFFFPFKKSFKHGFDLFSKNSELGFTNKEISYIDYPEGSFLLVSKGVFDTIGFFDENMFLYGEERDFAFRAWHKQIPSIINNAVTVFHKKSQSSIHNSSMKLYYYYRNFYYFIKKQKKTIPHYRCILWNILLMNLKNICSVGLHPSRYPDGIFKTLIALHWSIIDGFVSLRLGKKHYR